MSAIDIFDKAIRELYRGDGGGLSSYDEGWNDGAEAAAKALSAELAAIKAALIEFHAAYKAGGWATVGIEERHAKALRDVREEA